MIPLLKILDMNQQLVCCFKVLFSSVLRCTRINISKRCDGRYGLWAKWWFDILYGVRDYTYPLIYHSYFTGICLIIWIGWIHNLMDLVKMIISYLIVPVIAHSIEKRSYIRLLYRTNRIICTHPHYAPINPSPDK